MSSQRTARLARLRELQQRALVLGIDPAELSETARREIAVITASTLMFLLVAGAALVHAIAFGRWAELGYISVATVVGIGNLELLRRSRRPQLSGHVAIATIFALMAACAPHAGGFYHPSFAWTYLIPLGAAIVVGTRGAIAWSVATIGLSGGFWVAAESGIDLSLPMDDPSQRLSALVERTLSIVSISILGLCFAVNQRRSQQRLDSEQRRLELTLSAAVEANGAPSFGDGLEAVVRRVCSVLDWPAGEVVEVDVRGRSRVARSVSRPGLGRSVPEVDAIAAAEAQVLERALAGAEVAIVDVEAVDGGWFVVAVPVAPGEQVSTVLRFLGVDGDADERDSLPDVLRHVADQLEQVAVRNELQSQIRQEQKLAAVGQLAAGIAHEINNPMGFVRTNLNTMRECVHGAKDGEVLDLADLEEALDDSLEGVERAIAIVRDIVGFARESELSPSMWEPASVDSLLDDSIRVTSTDLDSERRIRFDVRSDVELECVPNALRQVFVNLLLNATQATGPGGRIEVSTVSDGDAVRVWVDDDGPGIAPEARERIFDPFFTTKEVGRGTGLGLSVSFEIVVAHRGELRTLPSPLGGARFEVRLPLA